MYEYAAQGKKAGDAAPTNLGGMVGAAIDSNPGGIKVRIRLSNNSKLIEGLKGSTNILCRKYIVGQPTKGMIRQLRMPFFYTLAAVHFSQLLTLLLFIDKIIIPLEWLSKYIESIKFICLF